MKRIEDIDKELVEIYQGEHKEKYERNKAVNRIQFLKNCKLILQSTAPEVLENQKTQLVAKINTLAGGFEQWQKNNTTPPGKKPLSVYEAETNLPEYRKQYSILSFILS